MKPLIIYHANCLDGAAAAMAAALKFGDDAEYRPTSYGDPAPTDSEVRGRDVFVFDFSYPRAELVRMLRANGYEMHGKDRNDEEIWTSPNHAPRLWVSEHHKTAQADLAGFPFCIFDTNKSGAVVAWEYLHCSGLADPPQDEGRVPELFRYVQDNELQRWELPHSREINAALRASGALVDFRKLEMFFWFWEASQDTREGLRNFDSTRRGLIRDGSAILRAERLMVERIAATAEEMEIEYADLPAGKLGKAHGTEVHSVRALAATSAVLQSEVGEALALESAKRGRDAVGVVYYRDGESGKWRVSLRSRDTEESDEQLRARVETMLAERGLHSRAEVVRMCTPAPDVSVVAKSFGGGGHARAAEFECDELPWVKQ